MRPKSALCFLAVVLFSGVFLSPSLSSAQTAPSCTTGSLQEQITCLTQLIAQLQQQLANLRQQLASDFHDGARVRPLVNLRIRVAPSVTATSTGVAPHSTSLHDTQGTITCNASATCPAIVNENNATTTWWRIDWDDANLPTGFSAQGSSEADYLEIVNGGSNSTPSITSITPSSGPVGTQVTISGSGFGDHPFLRFANTTLAILNTNDLDKTITFLIPQAITPCSVNLDSSCQPLVGQFVSPGTYNISVINGSNESNVKIFTVTSGTATSTNPLAPTITSLSPTSGAVGTQVTLTGTNLAIPIAATGQNPQTYIPSNTIHFGSFTIPNAYSFNGTTLTFAVPPVNPGTYPVSVTATNVNGTSNTVNFTVTGGTNVTSTTGVLLSSVTFTPSPLVKGQTATFTLAGSGFGTQQGTIRVADASGNNPTLVTSSYASQSGLTVNWSDTIITVTFPVSVTNTWATGQTTTKVRVIKPDSAQTQSNELSFISQTIVAGGGSTSARPPYPANSVTIEAYLDGKQIGYLAFLNGPLGVGFPSNVGWSLQGGQGGFTPLYPIPSTALNKLPGRYYLIGTEAGFTGLPGVATMTDEKGVACPPITDPAEIAAINANIKAYVDFPRCGYTLQPGGHVVFRMNFTLSNGVGLGGGPRNITYIDPSATTWTLPPFHVGNVIVPTDPLTVQLYQ